MANQKTLSQKIVDAADIGKDPTELAGFAAAGDVVAAGTTGSAITNASTAHALNATFSDTEVEGALNTLGTKMNSILAALREFQIIAP